MDNLAGTNLNNMWMVDPTMFDPTQRSNQFSLFNNAPLPWPPSYNGVPTDAMGRPIQSFQQWQQQNPAGVSLNSTPAQPQQQPQMDATAFSQQFMPSTYQGAGVARGGSPDMDAYRAQVQNAQALGQLYATQQAQQAQQPVAAAPQASGPPNNWAAAINALSNPGNPVTPGATVPMAQGFQPAGGVNAAFLNQAGPGMNQNFLSALRNIQGR